MKLNHPIIHPKHKGNWVAHRGKQPAPGPSAPSGVLADLLAQADALVAVATKIKADVAALQAQPTPVPTPTPAPVPQPTPKPPGQAEPNWPSFPGGASFIGTSTQGVSVWVDPVVGAPGLQNAKDLLLDADRVVAFNNTIFGTPTKSVNVIIFALNGATDGTGGADHMACDFTNGANIEVCASFGSSMRCSALFEAELSECSMNGQLCGLSTGESLSRWCAMAVSNNALSDFASAPTWIADGSVDWIDKTNPTDQDYDSIGCGMAFISCMISRGAALPVIAQAMVKLGDAGTLAQLYAKLSMGTQADAWPVFLSEVKTLPKGVTNDDPFGAVAIALKAKPHQRGT